MSMLNQPIQRLSVKLAADTAASRFVTFAGAVATAAGRAAGLTYVKGDADEKVAVTVLGTATAISGAAGIAVGDKLEVGADGKLILLTSTHVHVATALEAVTASDTEFRVFVVPN